MSDIQDPEQTYDKNEMSNDFTTNWFIRRNNKSNVSNSSRNKIISTIDHNDDDYTGDHPPPEHPDTEQGTNFHLSNTTTMTAKAVPLDTQSTSSTKLMPQCIRRDHGQEMLQDEEIGISLHDLLQQIEVLKAANEKRSVEIQDEKEKLQVLEENVLHALGGNRDEQRAPQLSRNGNLNTNEDSEGISVRYSPTIDSISRFFRLVFASLLIPMFQVGEQNMSSGDLNIPGILCASSLLRSQLFSQHGESISMLQQ